MPWASGGDGAFANSGANLRSVEATLGKAHRSAQAGSTCKYDRKLQAVEQETKKAGLLNPEARPTQRFAGTVNNLPAPTTIASKV